MRKTELQDIWAFCLDRFGFENVHYKFVVELIEKDSPLNHLQLNSFSASRVLAYTLTFTYIDPVLKYFWAIG